MSDQAGRLLVRIVAAWSALVQNGDAEPLTALLDPHVVWQGLAPELACHGRGDVMRLLRRQASAPPRITRLEAREAGDRVAISVEGPDLPSIEGFEDLSARTIVFTFRGAAVVEMRSFADPQAALDAIR